jgi:hypothetical protein
MIINECISTRAKIRRLNRSRAHKYEKKTLTRDFREGTKIYIWHIHKAMFREGEIKQGDRQGGGKRLVKEKEREKDSRFRVIQKNNNFYSKKSKRHCFFCFACFTTLYHTVLKGKEVRLSKLW